MRMSLSYLYMPLVLVFLISLYFFRASAIYQVEVIIGAAITYVTIALLHHHLDKSLTLEIIIEYILIAILVVIILQGQLIQ